jgi:hypothetical protein
VAHHAAGRGLDVAEAAPRLARERAGGAVEQQLGIAENGVEGSPQVMTEPRPSGRQGGVDAALVESVGRRVLTGTLESEQLKTKLTGYDYTSTIC